MRKYVDSCISLEALKQDSGLLPKPADNWNTFEPVEGDYAKVGEQDYQFTNGEWVEAEAEKIEAEAEKQRQTRPSFRAHRGNK